MTKYTHDEIRSLLEKAESPLKLDLPDYKAELYKEAPAIIRQLLDELQEVDDKRETAVRMLRQSEKRIAELEALLAEHKALDPLSNVPPFDWGPEGESE